MKKTLKILIIVIFIIVVYVLGVKDVLHTIIFTPDRVVKNYFEAIKEGNYEKYKKTISRDDTEQYKRKYNMTDADLEAEFDRMHRKLSTNDFLTHGHIGVNNTYIGTDIAYVRISYENENSSTEILLKRDYNGRWHIPHGNGNFGFYSYNNENKKANIKNEAKIENEADIKNEGKIENEANIKNEGKIENKAKIRSEGNIRNELIIKVDNENIQNFNDGVSHVPVKIINYYDKKVNLESLNIWGESTSSATAGSYADIVVDLGGKPILGPQEECIINLVIKTVDPCRSTKLYFSYDYGETNKVYEDIANTRIVF